jgi:hypothetical protein
MNFVAFNDRIAIDDDGCHLITPQKTPTKKSYVYYFKNVITN